MISIRRIEAFLRQAALAALIAAAAGAAMPQPAQAEQPAKQIFGAAKLPAVLPARAIGFYSRGCLAGGVAIAADGPTWQAMRLSRNRRWGHPDLVALVERLSRDAAAKDGWPGLLVGDLAQHGAKDRAHFRPAGGGEPFHHAFHVGLGHPHLADRRLRCPRTTSSSAPRRWGGWRSRSGCCRSVVDRPRGIASARSSV